MQGADYGDAAMVQKAQDPEPGGIQEVEQEITRLGDAIDSLRVDLTPVMRFDRPEMEVLSEPRQEPPSSLRGFSQRLLDLTSRVNQIRRQLDL